MHIKEFAQLTGVSVRTLHYYDEIGLLKPSAVDSQNGYREYDTQCFARMQEILFYRELDFPLKEIGDILCSPDYDKQAALHAQKRLLTLKKERLEQLIQALDDALKGEDVSMNVFDNSKFESQRAAYAKEAKEKWGDTAAYRESLEKTQSYSKEQWSEIHVGLNALMAEFAAYKQNGLSHDSEAVQALVKVWQDYITEHYYTCTKEILAGLGEMYVADARFKANMDRHGEGTAQFLCEAIRVYCG